MIKYSFIYLLTCLLWIAFSCGTKPEAALPEQQGNSNASQLDTKPISRLLSEKNHLPIAERIAFYRQLKKENRADVQIDEDGLNIYGYSLLWDNKIDEAIEIFKLVVAEYPESSNAYDSLGEAYLKKGNQELALVNYEQSLRMNPDNFGAEDQIEKIKFPERKPIEPHDKFHKIYSIDSYRSDLDQLGDKLMEVHPEVFKFITKKEFLQRIEEKKRLLNETTSFAQFTWHCSEIIASINCSHTSLGGFYTESTMLQLPYIFPVQTRLVNGKMFVVDPLGNSESLKIKDEILTINTRPAQEIVEEISRHIPSQGHIQTTQIHELNAWSTEMIPYALNFPDTYTITVRGKENPIVLLPSNKFVAPYANTSLPKCKEGLCLEFMEKNRTAILTISTFNFYPFDNRIKLFEDFMDSCFATLKKEKTKNLLIDVRQNGGGSSESSIYLLRYLMNAPFRYIASEAEGGVAGKDARKNVSVPFKNRFTGNLFFLIDGRGNSTTGHFMSLVKAHNLGIIIGEELGSNQFCTAGQTPCRLKNTKLMFYVATNSNLTTATSLPIDRGIFPDFEVTQSIDDYVNKIDTVKEFAISLIAKGQTKSK